MSWLIPSSWVGGPSSGSTGSASSSSSPTPATKSLIERTLEGIAIVRTQHSIAPTSQESILAIQAELDKLDAATAVKEEERSRHSRRANVLSEQMKAKGRTHPDTPALMRQYTTARKAVMATEQVMQSIDTQRGQLHQQQMFLERKIISESTEKTLESVSLTMAEFKDSTSKLEDNMDVIESAADSVEDAEATMERPLGAAASWDLSIQDELSDIFGDEPIVIQRSVPVKKATKHTRVEETDVNTDSDMLLTKLSTLPSPPSTSPPERPTGPVRHLADPIAVGQSAPVVRVVRDKKEIERLRAQARQK